MQVFIRHFEDIDGLDCGPMNPEQLHHFVADIKRRGVGVSGVVEHFGNYEVQYVYDSDNHLFYAEIVFGDY